MDQNASSREVFFSTKILQKPPLTKVLLVRFLHAKKSTVFTSHIHYHKGMRALSEQPPAGPKNFTQVPAASVTHQISPFSILRKHAVFAPWTRPSTYHFPSSINVLGPSARTISFLNVLTPHWQNLSEIHRAKPKLWTKTCHHVANFLFDQNFAKTPCDKSIACTLLDTQKESSPQARSSAIRGRERSASSPRQDRKF